MKTLLILFSLWGILSAYKLFKFTYKKQFDIFNFNKFYFFGVIFGLGIIISFFILLCIKYLP